MSRLRILGCSFPGLRCPPSSPLMKTESSFRGLSDTHSLPGVFLPARPPGWVFTSPGPLAAWGGPRVPASSEQGAGGGRGAGGQPSHREARPALLQPAGRPAGAGEGSTGLWAGPAAPPTRPSSSQPAVEPPPFHGSDLCVEGVGVRRAGKQMPPISGANCPSALLDPQPLKVRSPSAVPGPAPGRPPTAVRGDLRPDDAQALACTLPAPLKRPAERRCEAQSARKSAVPTRDFQLADGQAPKIRLPKAESDRRSGADTVSARARPAVLPSVKTPEGALFQPLTPPGSAAGALTPRAAGVACSVASRARRGRGACAVGAPARAWDWPGCWGRGVPAAAVPGAPHRSEWVASVSLCVRCGAHRVGPGASGPLGSRIQFSEVPDGADPAWPASLSRARAQGTRQVWGSPESLGVALPGLYLSALPQSGRKVCVRKRREPGGCHTPAWFSSS